MRADNWLLSTVAITIAAAAVIATANVLADPFGLYHSGPAQRLVYGDPRIAKYLLNQRHVPEHFNAVLVGPSLSANWNMSAVQALRVYNDSLNGGNSVEEAAIVSAALARPGIEAAFVIVHPALTWTHDFKTVQLSPNLRWSTLGSVGLFQAYIDMLNIRLGRARQRIDAAGTEEPEFVPTRMNENMRRLWAGADFEVDPVAMEAYLAMLREMRARRVHVIFVVPPALEELLETKRGAFDRYVEAIRGQAAPGDEWIDFTSAEYAAFRNSRGNFVDGVHFTPSAARQIVSELNARVNAWIAAGTLSLAQDRR